MKNLICFIYLSLNILVTGCAFKPHHKATISAAMKLDALEAKYDWTQGGALQLGDQNKAVRRLLPTGDSIYRVDEPVTLPEDIPNPVYIVTTLPKNGWKAEIAFTKAKVKIGDRSFQLKVNHALGNMPISSITFEISGLKTAFEQRVSQSGTLTIEIFSDEKKQLTYSFAFRTPPSQVALELIGVPSSAKELGLSQQMIAPQISGGRAGMVKILKITNNESVPVDVQMPRNIAAEVSQKVTRQNYLDRECHGGDFKYWSSEWKDIYSKSLVAVSLDQSFLFGLSELDSSETKTALNVRLEPGETSYIALYSVSEKAWQYANGSPITSTANVQHLPAGCFKLPPQYRDDTTRRFFQDILIGDSRGDIEADFLEDVKAGIRYSDLDLSRDPELRVITGVSLGYKSKL